MSLNKQKQKNKKKIIEDICEKCHKFHPAVKAGVCYYRNYTTMNAGHTPSEFLVNPKARVKILKKNIYCKCDCFYNTNYTGQKKY